MPEPQGCEPSGGKSPPPKWIKVAGGLFSIIKIRFSWDSQIEGTLFFEI